MDNIYIGEEYLVEPTSIRFDQEMVEFNRVHTVNEYMSTKISIQGSLGQVSPININSETGLCENGRHRVRICIELGIQVKCIQVDGNVDRAIRIELYNLDEVSGRDLNTAQKAIQAHKYSMISKCSLDECAKRFNTNVRATTAANTIYGLGRTDVISSISKDGYWIKPDGKKVKDLRAIASYLRSITEELEDTLSGSEINYEDMINTEKGKLEFWRLRTLATMSSRELSLILVDYMNEKYRPKVNKETGEII